MIRRIRRNKEHFHEHELFHIFFVPPLTYFLIAQSVLIIIASINCFNQSKQSSDTTWRLFKMLYTKLDLYIKTRIMLKLKYK